MAVVLETTINRYRGLSTDTKPVVANEEDRRPLPVGSTFTERDTGARYVWNGSSPWMRQEQTIEAILAELIDLTAQVLKVVTATHQGHEQHLWEEEVEIDESSF